MMNTNEAPPLYPMVPEEELEKMSAEEFADYGEKLAMSAIARYAGRPELMLAENPHLNFRNPPKAKKPAA